MTDTNTPFPPPLDDAPKSPPGWTRSFVQRQVQKILGPLARTAQLRGQPHPCAIILEKGGARMTLATGRTWFEAFDVGFIRPYEARQKAREQGPDAPSK